MSRSSSQKCLRIPPRICLPSDMCQTTSSNVSGNTTSNMSRNTTSDNVWEYRLKKTRSAAPIVFFFFFFDFLDTTAKLFKSIPLECVVYPLDFYFSYVYSCSLLASFLVYVVGLRERSRRYFAHLCVISPCVCSVREIGGVGVGGEDFSISVSSVC